MFLLQTFPVRQDTDFKLQEKLKIFLERLFFDVVVIHGSDGGKTSSPVWAMTIKEGLTETFKWGELKKKL